MAANLWNDADAAGLRGLAALVYRSNLLGRDRTLVNIFGGNTSVKVTERDHMGREVEADMSAAGDQARSFKADKEAGKNYSSRRQQFVRHDQKLTRRRCWQSDHGLNRSL